MANNTSPSDPNFHINEIAPFLPNTSLQFALTPSYNHKPKKKRTKHVTSSSSSSSKPDLNSPKIQHTCTECGKQFYSLKALFGHMRCHPERQWRGIIPPPNHRNPNLTSSSTKHHRSSSNWVSCMFQEDHEVASCLLMLSKDVTHSSSECRGCKKVFGSHQALGRHRASHNKNVKGCFAITNVTNDQDHRTKIDMFSGHHHKCSLCFRVFSSVQALRCHCERDEETMIGDSLDLNVPATIGSCSLDLRLGL